MRIRFSLVALAISLAVPGALGAQDSAPLSRADAIRAALERGPRLGVARADTAVAAAQLRTARAYQNPVLSLTYSKAVPQYHFIAELPLDAPWLRSSRIGSAEAGRSSAQYRFAYSRAAIALEADTTYTRVLAAMARARLSRQSAEAADSLRGMAAQRRNAGDASDLDVELAAVNAGQQANAAAADSLALWQNLLDLQVAIGLTADRIVVTPSDSLFLPSDDSTMSAGTPLVVAAAEAALVSADLAARFQHQSALPVPAITFGFERGDPTGAEPGVLPTFGVAIPIPLLNRNGGAIAQAEAERDRAQAELEATRLESAARIAGTRRVRQVALARVERDARLVESANRVAAMSLRAYREGAVSLPSVLEAQRNAREILTQYVEDLASAWNAAAALRVYTMSTVQPR
ncbi:MAG: TolC family protein [Gemmatimonadales bacterium]